MRPARGGILVLIAWCLAVAFALQVPLAWLCSLGLRVVQSGSSATLLAPSGATSDAETIMVYAYASPGARAVSAIAYPTQGMSRRYLEHNTAGFGSAEVAAVAAPWSPDEVHPALADAAAWPARTGARSTPGGAPWMAIRLTHHETSGWPLACVEGRVRYDPATGLFRTEGMYIPAGPSWMDASTGNFCFQPRWGGYLFNTLIDGLLLAGAIVGVRFAARATIGRFRGRRGRCPRCSYDLSATPAHLPCPECGARQAAGRAPTLAHAQPPS